MRQWVILLVVAAALAGCADQSARIEDEQSTSIDQELEVTEDTGIIRGVVVDPAIVPVADAEVAVNGQDMTTTTNENGEFGFDELDPGTYFLDVSKPGFLPIQQAVEVEAGVERPPIVRVLLQVDETFNPYYELLQYAGFYQCGTSAVVVCAAPNILLGEGTTDDTSTPTFYWDTRPDFVQTEMVWESTQTLSPELYFEMEALDSGCDGSSFLDNAEGESPIRTRVNATVLEDATIGGDDCGIYYSVFAGDTTGGTVPPWGVGFSIEQDFEWFISSFYGYGPPEPWWFIEDGEYPPPL